MGRSTGSVGASFSDHGIQYAAFDYVDLLKDKVQISANRSSLAYAVRLIRIIKAEEVDLSSPLIPIRVR
jgi:hypothetical protein